MAELAQDVRDIGRPAAAAHRPPPRRSSPVARRPRRKPSSRSDPRPDGRRSPAAKSPDCSGSVGVSALIAENGLDGASIEELIKCPTTPVARAPEEPAVVDITALTYRGRSALTRAAAVRLEIRDAMATHAAGAVLRPLVEELLDLVDLAQVE